MLKFKVNGVYLNLPEDIQLNLTIENPLLLSDRIPFPNTLSFDLPATPTNLRITGNPDRVTSKDALKSSQAFTAEFGPIVFLTGTLIVMGFDKTIKCQIVGAVFSDYVKSNLYQVEMDKYEFGVGHSRFINFTDPLHWSAIYYNTIMQSVSTPVNFTAAPIRLTTESFAANNNLGFGEDGLTMMNCYTNYYNARTLNYTLGRAKTFVFPQPFLHYVIDNIFGDLLENNPFGSGDLAKLVVVNFFHDNYKLWPVLDTIYPSIPIWVNIPGGGRRRFAESDLTAEQKRMAYFHLNSFLPAMPANEFLKNLLKVFCASLYFIQGKFRIVLNKDIISDTAVENWSSKLIGRLATVRQEKMYYNYGYDDFTEKQVENESGSPLSTIQALFTENVDNLEDGGDFFIETTRQLFNKKLVDGAVEYSLLNSGLAGRENPGEGSAFDMVSSISPLRMNLHKYWWDSSSATTLTKGDWFVPESEASRFARPATANIMFYHGLKNTFITGDKYPFLTSHNYDHLGNKLGDTSLAWHGADGLLAKYHSEFKTWVEKDKMKAYGMFLLTALDLKNLDLAKRKNIKGKNFFIEKINLTLRKYSIDPAQVDFIEG